MMKRQAMDDLTLGGRHLDLVAAPLCGYGSACALSGRTRHIRSALHPGPWLQVSCLPGYCVSIMPTHHPTPF